MMRVLLYEPVHTGHHYAYLARLLPGFLDLPVETVIATSAAGVASKEFELTLAPFQDRCRIEPCCPPLSQSVFRNGWQRVRNFIHACNRFNPDHAYILYGDGMWPLMHLQRLLTRRSITQKTPTEAWFYRGGFTYPEAKGPGPAIKRSLFRGMLRSGLFAKVHLDDEIMHAFAKSACPQSQWDRFTLTPNPVVLYPRVSAAAARSKLGLPTDGRFVASSGMISEWKGIDRLLRAFHLHLTQRGQPTDRLVIAGPHSDPIRQLLNQPPFDTLISQNRVISVDRFLNSQEMYDFAAAGDLTAACYPAHSGRSSILLWSAAAGRPTLGTARGCIGHVIRENRLGHTCNPLDLPEFSKAITQALDAPWSPQDADRARHYAEFHSVENYQRLGTQLLRQRLGLS